MDSLRLPIAMLVFVLLATACTPGTGDRAATQVPVTVTVSGGTPNAPTAVPGSTPLPWWGGTAANLDVEPRLIGKPADLAVAGDGTIYLAEIGGHRILHIAATGDMNAKVLHVWGKYSGSDQAQPAPPGTFNEPWGITTAPDGLVYVADTWNHRIQVFTADGVFVRAWGEFGQGSEPDRFFGPRDVAVTAGGLVFVSDTGNKRIVAFSREGRFIGQIGGEGTEWGQFREPVGLALGPDGDLYVADQGNRRVQVLSVGADGTLTPKAAWPVQAWAHNEMAYKPYICVPGDRVFITDPEAGSVQEYAAGGEFVRAYDLNHTGYLNYGFVYGIAADPGGALWVSDLAGGAGVLVKIYPLP